MIKKDIEDIKFLSLIVKELRRQVDLSAENFTFAVNEHFMHNDEGDIIRDHLMRNSVEKDIQIIWSPGHNSNHPFSHIDNLTIRLWPTSNTLMFSLYCDPYPTQATVATAAAPNPVRGRASMLRSSDHSVTHSYDLKKENQKLVWETKLDFIYVYLKTKKYQEVEIPRRNREHLVNVVCQAFPTLLDSLMLESIDEET
jgi:hypothetical protein